MSWSVTSLFSVMLTLTTLTTSECQRRQSRPLGDVGDITAVDNGVLERFLLQRARVEAVKRGILQQLGLTEAPRPPPAHNRSSAGSVIDDDDGRSVMAAYRRTVAQTRHRVVSNDVVDNDVVDDVTRNDVTHGDAPSAMQFYSFKGHGAAGSGCDESGEHTLLFRVDIPEPKSPGIETVVTSAILKLFARRRRRNSSLQHASSPSEDIVVVTVFQLVNDDQRRHHTDNDTEVTSRAVRLADDEAGGTAWEEFDVTSAVKRHVIQMGGGGKAVGLLRLRVKVNGAADRSRRHLTFGEDWCDDVNVRELRHRHHPVLNVLTRDRPTTRHRRTRRSVLPDVSLSSSSADEPLCTAGDDETRCCRRPLWISFREIGWDDWILAPDGYQAYYCYGSCPPGHRTAHNHAAIRELVLTAAPGGGLPIPRPACTATKLGSLALAHYLNGRRVVSIFNDMIVEECRCA